MRVLSSSSKIPTRVRIFTEAMYNDVVGEGLTTAWRHDRTMFRFTAQKQAVGQEGRSWPTACMLQLLSNRATTRAGARKGNWRCKKKHPVVVDTPHSGRRDFGVEW